MALSSEWRERIEYWERELGRQPFQPLGQGDLRGFCTFEQLRPEEALERPMEPYPDGTRWGRKWEYGWFYLEVAVPPEAEGRTLVVRPRLGREETIYVLSGAEGGSEAGVPRALGGGARDDRYHVLTRRARSGERFRVLIESYAGHGGTPFAAGPVPPGRESVPEPPERQHTIVPVPYGVLDEDVFQCWVDFATLWRLREAVADKDSLRVAEVDAGLREATTIVDLEAPREEFVARCRRARERMRPLLECRNGSTAPTLHCFGHAHLDTAWLWPLAETMRKAERTFANQLALMDRYPEYVFLCSQPHQYRWIKEQNPELYGRIKEAVRRGQWIPEGGMWIEPDTNMPSGEALIRQFLHGKRFFREEFGVESRMLWLPDVFGYSAAMPQIMAGCGVPYFSTAKIFWAYHGGEQFPFNTFVWEGADGSEVLAHFCFNYNAEAGPDSTIARWNERVQKDGINARLFPFGWGDGGGGPTRHHLAFLERQHDLEGAPRARQTSPVEFFEELEEQGKVPAEARYVGELYFQAHRGVWTAQAKTKRGNRKGELALREAEWWLAVAVALGVAVPDPGAAGGELGASGDLTLDEAWKLLLLNQFHDILPGSSIARVHEEAERDYARIQAAAERWAGAANAAIAGAAGGDSGAREPVSRQLFNSLSWDREDVVFLPTVPSDVAELRDAEGQCVPLQRYSGGAWAYVLVPAGGWTTVRAAGGGGRSAQAQDRTGAGQGTEATGAGSASGTGQDATVRLEGRALENGLLRIELDECGRLASIYDKETDRELAAAPGNELRLFQDVPARFDAWDIDSTYRATEIPVDSEARIEQLEAGPLVGAFRVKRAVGQSELTQVVRIYRGSRRVDFDTTVEWQEKHRLLKVSFPVRHYAHEALHEIQYGYVARPTHASRQYDRDRFEVCNHRWTALAEEGRGFAVLNDCKYGVDVSGSSINLTLLRAPVAPDMHADRGTQRFTYAVYFWNGQLSESGLVQAGYELNRPTVVCARDVEAGRPGSGEAGESAESGESGEDRAAARKAPSAGSARLVATDAPNVIVDCLKPAEDGSGDIIARAYESARTATRSTLRFGFPFSGVQETDMLEENGRPVDSDGTSIRTDFRPFEVKTFRLTPRAFG